ncbi:hypothetical protein OG588_10100 [Streptomyces prunicolor]|uniref:hypothetical protein n=1 Tax=Streptomyces prunicolor TaxID=67348 RepID=UPI00386F6789|nr:hypothetical protein OG588_10100 [Streptomyces prunicolor]
MSWSRALLTALAVCALLLAGSAGCGSGDTQGRKGEGVSPSPVGKVLDDTDEQGRHYREVGKKGAPEVGIEVEPDAAEDSWDVTLTVHDFRFSPAGAKSVAVAGRGTVRLLVDGRTVARLRVPEYRLAGDLVQHGTHHVTARLYADDGTVWAVHGKPVESTADITASVAQATPDGSKVPSSSSTSAQGSK